MYWNCDGAVLGGLMALVLVLMAMRRGQGPWGVLARLEVTSTNLGVLAKLRWRTGNYPAKVSWFNLGHRETWHDASSDNEVKLNSSELFVECEGQEERLGHFVY
jgi:hypothetical protein